MASSPTTLNSVNILHNHNSLDLDQLRGTVPEEQAPTSFPNNSNSILILHLLMDMHTCQTQLYTILTMVQTCHRIRMSYRSTCSKAPKCKVLRKAFPSKVAHNIRITVHPLNNNLTHSKSNSCMPKNSEERLCHQLSLNKNDRNRDLHHSRNNSNLLNSNNSRLSKIKRSSNLHLSKCLSL